MFNLKSLFVLTMLVALVATGFLLFSEMQKNEARQKKVAEGKLILNEYYLKALLADPSIVGRPESEMNELAVTCDHRVELQPFLAKILQLKPMTTSTNVQFPSVTVRASDHLYCYDVPIPKSFQEGVVLAGFAVYVQDEKVIGIYPLFVVADS